MMAAVTALLLLGPAAARADGPVDPIATAYAARILHAPAAVSARVIDGYLQLWLSARPGHRVVVLDQLGAPWLRFDAGGGVEENRASLLFYVSQVPVEAVPPSDINAATPPRWFRVADGHAFRWRDGRLQALAHQQLTPGQTDAGPWSIPLLVDGRRTAISGALFTRPAPSPVWFWPVAVIVLCVLAAWRLRSRRLDRRLALGLSGALMAGLVVVAVARFLHGRPGVTAFQVLEVAVTVAAVAVAGRWQLRGRFPAAIPFVLAFTGLWAGLTFLPVLTHAYALVIGPAWLIRAATALLLGAGLSLVLVALRRPLVP